VVSRHRDVNEELKDELKEMTQMYLLAKQDKDRYRAQLKKFQSDVSHFDQIVQEKVKKVLKNREDNTLKENQQLLQSNKKLVEHQAIFKETIE